MSEVEQLYKLQQMDTEIDEKKRRLGDVLKAQKGDVALTSAQKRMETAVAALQSWQAKRRELNLELDGLNQKTKNSERRLYSGKVTNPKELSDLQQEIESLSRRREALEETILEVMIELEEAQKEHDRAAAVLKEAEASWSQKSARLQQEQNELALRLHHLMTARKQQTALLPAAALAEYDKLRQRSGGVAVAKLRVNQCLACQITVSANKVKEAREGKLVYCGGCGRILYPV